MLWVLKCASARWWLFCIQKIQYSFFNAYFMFFSSPEQGSGWAFVITCRPSFVHHLSIICPSTHLNDYSSETPGPIFFKVHVEPSVKRGLKIYTMVTVRESRWLPCPYMVKTLKEPRKLWGWILIYSIMDSRSTKFAQMMTLGWLWPLYGKVKFVPPCICMGTMLKSHFLKMY